MKYNARFDFPPGEIKLILKSSFHQDSYYGVDTFESKRLKILMAKYGVRKGFHSLPGHLTATLHPFTWNRLKQNFKVDMNRKVSIQINTLEEVRLLHAIL